MEPYKLINKLDPTKDLNKDIALQFDAGKVQSEKYGDANLTGHFLFMHRHGELPEVLSRQIEDRAYDWLKESGLEEYQDYLCEKINVSSMVAYSAPGVDPSILGLYFQLISVLFLFDDALLKLKQLNANDPVKSRKDVLKLVQSLISIVKSKGNEVAAEMGASKNPTFKSVCQAIAYICKRNYEQTDTAEYKRFAREIVDHFRANKWEQELRAVPYSESDYILIRSANVGIYPLITQICISKGVHISDEIRMHPLLQKYNRNAILHSALCNDVLSLHKEIAEDEKENFVLVKCQKHSLQKSINKTVKAINELMIDLKKDRIKLRSYFPTDHNLENFLQTVEGVVDGYLAWYQYSKRYGKTKFENYLVQYDCDYNSWLEKIGITDIEDMKEPTFSV